MRAVDLSLPLHTGMQVYPGDPEVAIEDALSVLSDGVAVARLGLNTHAGTHLDAPAHTIVGGRTADEIPLEWLAGDARILRVINPQPGKEIGVDDLQGGVPEQVPRIVLIATGWDRHAGTAAALTHPYLSPELAAMLVDRGAQVVGIDALSPDPTEKSNPAGSCQPVASPAGDSPQAFLPAHAAILGSDGVIVENLAALDRVPESCQVTLLPLRIDGGDGSPIRAVAWLDA